MSPADAQSAASSPELLSVSEAARRLGVGRARVYQLVAAGALDDSGLEPLRITVASVERRLQASPPPGALLAPLSAWAVLALASGDPAFRAHVAGLLSDPDRSRARTRLQREGLLTMVPRLRGRATVRRFGIAAESMVDLLTDARLVLGGASAARALGWDLTAGKWPLEGYVPEAELAGLVEQYGLERDEAGDLVLRTVPDPWPFPPHARVALALVAALDLAEAAEPSLSAVGEGRLQDLAREAVADWRQRPPRRRPIRPLVPTGVPGVLGRHQRRALVDHIVWDDRAEQDARHLVALLFVAATPLRRADVTETLRVSPARLARACAVLRDDPPRGLSLEEAGDQLTLVSAPDCAAVVERHLKPKVPEALSQAAREALAIVAYEQPVSRADIRAIRSVDSDSAVETLMARGLVAEDPRFGGRGRPAFLVTTPEFLRYFGLGSLADLPPRPTR